MSDYSKLKQLAEASMKAWDQHSKADSHKFYQAWCKAEEEFATAATEEVVLALIAENERLRADLDGEMAQARDFNLEHEELKHERDQLKAERDNLREDRDGLLEAGAHLL